MPRTAKIKLTDSFVEKAALPQGKKEHILDEITRLRCANEYYTSTQRQRNTPKHSVENVAEAVIIEAFQRQLNVGSPARYEKYRKVAAELGIRPKPVARVVEEMIKRLTRMGHEEHSMRAYVDGIARRVRDDLTSAKSMGLL